jgi:hypothetical protein
MDVILFFKPVRKLLGIMLLPLFYYEFPVENLSEIKNMNKKILGGIVRKVEQQEKNSTFVDQFRNPND